eukprot:TRINITY_DN14757_c0_g1_i1.p1 TRINITY_DN14757_c0_g1~~TRINITY_DN14757_c0_g1_i1.p1  ORF type:complete len:166 (+),score=33.28 TRINITY_DN14757_c0_g1_i1:114-611(+)
MSSDSDYSDSDSADDSPIEKSFIHGGRETTEIVKKVSGKRMKLVISIPKKSYSVGSSVVVDIEIENETKREIKEIGAFLQTTQKDGTKKDKKAKPQQSGTTQQYFQGARFPLPGPLGYKGEVSYPVPHVPNSSDENIHQLVITCPYRTGLTTRHLTAILPITVVG